MKKLMSGDMPYLFKIFRYMKPYGFRYAISQIMYSSQGFALPFILSVFIGSIMSAIVAADRDAVFNSGVQLGIMLGAFLLTLLIGIYVNMITIARAEMDLKRDMFRVFLRTGIEDATHSGEGIAAINTEADTALQIFQHPMFQFLYSVITIIGASITIFAMEWRIGLVLLVVGFLSFIMQHRFTAPLAKLGKAQLEANADSLKAASNTFSGAMAIRAYNMQPQAFLTFDHENKRLRKLNIREGLIRMGQNLFGTVEGWLTTATVFGFGGWLVASGYAPFYLLASIYVMASSLTSAIGSLGRNYAELQPPLAGAKRVFAILERPIPTQSGTTRPAKGYALKVNNFTFQYRDAAEPAFRDISLEIPENQMYAFVGASGSGKSTLLKTLVGLYDRPDLNIQLGDLSFKESTLTNWRNHFAYVDQGGKLFDMTIRENIALGLNGKATEVEVTTAAKQAAAHDFITALEQGYDTPCGEKGASLSGGQRQRIAIARALIKKAPILVFDEATSALDAETESQIMDTIQSLRKNYTILMATHNLESAKTADEVITMSVQ